MKQKFSEEILTEKSYRRDREETASTKNQVGDVGTHSCRKTIEQRCPR